MPDQTTIEILFKLIDKASVEAKKIASAFKEITVTSKETSTSADKAATSVDKVGKASAKTATDMGKASKATDKFDDSLDKLGDEAKSTGDELGKVGKNNSLGKLNKSLNDTNTSLMSVGTAVGALGAILGAPFVAGVAKAAEFQQSMATVQAVSGATTEEFKSMNDVAKELGRTTRFTAAEAADGFKFLSMAGLEASQSMEALPSVLQLAQAGALDLGRAADITTNILTGYGKKASELAHVNDVLVTGFTSSNSTLEELGTAFTYVGPIAKGVGADFEHLVGTLGSLHNAGIKGSMAGTTLRGTLDALYNPTKQESELMAELGERIGGVGLQIKDSEGKFVGFTNIVEQLEKSGIGADEALKLFGQRAGPGMVALIQQGSDALGKFDEKMKNVDGAAASVAKTMDETFEGSVKKLGSAFDGLLVSIGDKLLPLLTMLVDGMTWVVGAFQAAHDALGPFAVILDVMLATLSAAAVAAAALGAAWAFIGAPLVALGTSIASAGGLVAVLSGAFATLTAAVSSAATAIIGFLLTNPVGWAILAVSAIASLVAAFTLFREDLDETINSQNALAKSSKAVSDSIKEYQADIADTADETDEYTKKNLKLRESLLRLSEENENLSAEALAAADSINKVTGEINDQGAAIEVLKKKALSDEFAAIAESSRAAEEKFSDLARGTGLLEKVWDSTIGAMGALWDGFVSAWKAQADFFLKGLSTIAGVLGIDIPNSFDSFADAADEVLFGTKKGFDELGKEIEGFGSILTDEEKVAKAAYDGMAAEGQKVVDRLMEINGVELGDTVESLFEVAEAEGLLKDKTGNLAQAMKKSFVKMQSDAKKNADKTVKELLKVSDPNLIKTDAMVSEYKKGLERLVDAQLDANGELVDNTKYFGDETVSQYKDIFRSMTDEQGKGFIQQFQLHERNAKDIYDSSYSAADKEKALAQEKLNFLVGIEKKLGKEQAAARVAGFDDILKATDEYASLQMQAQEQSYLEQLAGAQGNADEIKTIEEANVTERVAIEGGLIAKKLALSKQNVANAKQAHTENSSEYDKAVKKQQGFAKALTDFQLRETARWSNDLKSKLNDSLAKEKEYADKIQELANKIRDAKTSTEDKVRSIRQRGMDEARKQADLQLQADEKLLESKRALADGDYERAEAFASASQDIASGLTNEAAAISGVEAAGRQLTDVYEDQKTATEEALVAQKEQSKQLAESLKQVSENVKNLVDELRLLRGVDIPINVDVSGATSNVDALQAKISAAKGDLSIKAEVDNGQAITSLGELTDFTGRFKDDVGTPTSVDLKTTQAQKELDDVAKKAEEARIHNTEPWGMKIEVDGVMVDVDRMGRIISDTKDAAATPTDIEIRTDESYNNAGLLNTAIKGVKETVSEPSEFKLDTNQPITSLEGLRASAASLKQEVEEPAKVEVDSTEAELALDNLGITSDLLQANLIEQNTLTVDNTGALMSLSETDMASDALSADMAIPNVLVVDNTGATTALTETALQKDAFDLLMENPTVLAVATDMVTQDLAVLKSGFDAFFAEIETPALLTMVTETASAAITGLHAKATAFFNETAVGSAIRLGTETATAAVTSLKAVATEFFGFLTMGSPLGVDTTEAEEKIAGIKEVIPTIGEQPFAVSADSTEAEATIATLSESGSKTIAVSADTSQASSSINTLEQSGSKSIKVDADTSSASAAIKPLVATEHKKIVVHVQKVQESSTGGIAGEFEHRLADGGKPSRNLDKGAKLPGFGFQDVVPALLTWGERVLNAGTTKALDNTFPGMMDRINQTRSPEGLKSILQSHAGVKKLALGGLATFNTGGVAASIPSASSVPIAAGGGVNLSMPISIAAEGQGAEDLEKSFRTTIIPALKEAVINNTGSITSVLKRQL